MAKSSSSSVPSATLSLPPIKLEQYSHSLAHYAVAVGDRNALSRIIATLPRLPDPDEVQTESDSLAQERLSDQISAVLDRRDVPYRETPLHLAVRLNDVFAARTLASAGADISLQNSAGWNPLQEALCRRSSEVAFVLLRLHHRAAWAKWRRRLPRVIAVMQRMRDFYMEISFHFESSVIPFVGKIAPSDTYKIWKRGGNLRADTSLAGFDGLKIQRADQSFLFLGDGDQVHNVSSGTLLVINRDQKKIFNAFENAETPMSESDIAGFCSQTGVYRPGMDVTKAELVGRTNWRRQEKIESVGEWKARIYEIHNVIFSFRSRKVACADSDAAGSEQVLPLELDEDEDGFLVAENPNFGLPDRRRHSSFVREDRNWVPMGRKSVDLASISAAPPHRKAGTTAALAVPQTKEKEYVKNLKPSVWLTDQFPLKTDELMPLLDILANKVKAVRRLRELLTTKFPPGTFPVKVAVPVLPTVRVIVTFTKFVELPPVEQFYTPFSSPRQLLRVEGGGEPEAEEQQNLQSYSSSLLSSTSTSSSSSSSASAWLRRNNSMSFAGSKPQQKCLPIALESDPFAIPGGYTWSNLDAKSQKLKKSKSVRKSK